MNIKPFHKQLRFRIIYGGQLQNCSIDGASLRDILHKILGLTETDNNAIRNCIRIGFERHSIDLGEKSAVYSITKIEEAVHSFFGDSAGRMIMNKIRKTPNILL